MKNPGHVDTVIFDVQLPPGPVEVVGVPFEYPASTFAVHRPANQDPLAARYVVSQSTRAGRCRAPRV
ncbi:MAG TPA: hypothetical protein VG105_04020 [Paraburkholderia sp.]|jgi:hypothetical protein|nr:hypothetical protein [Paraburkholderia sp.]